VEDNDIAAPPEVVVGTNGTPTALRAVAWAATAILARAYTVAHRSEPGLETHTELSDAAPVAALAAPVAALAAPVAALAALVAALVAASRRAELLVVTADAAALTVAFADAAALTVAFADAERHASPLLVVHAQHRPPDTHEPLLDELGAWLARWPDVPTEVRVLHGGAGEQVLHASRGARSLVLGTSGHNLAARAALGSTSRTLVRLAPCPVTVVRRNLDPAVAGTPAREVRVVGS